MKDAETYYNQSKNILKQAEEKTENKNLDPASVANMLTNFQSPRASK